MNIREMRKQIRDLEEQITSVKADKLKIFLASKREQILSLPQDTELRWRDVSESVHVDDDEAVVVEEDTRWCFDGRMTKRHNAGETFIILRSWKSYKKSKTTSYVLYDRRRKMTADFRG